MLRGPLTLCWPAWLMYGGGRSQVLSNHSVTTTNGLAYVHGQLSYLLQHILVRPSTLQGHHLIENKWSNWFCFRDFSSCCWSLMLTFPIQISAQTTLKWKVCILRLRSNLKLDWLFFNYISLYFIDLEIYHKCWIGKTNEICLEMALVEKISYKRDVQNKTCESE